MSSTAIEKQMEKQAVEKYWKQCAEHGMEGWKAELGRKGGKASSYPHNMKHWLYTHSLLDGGGGWIACHTRHSKRHSRGREEGRGKGGKGGEEREDKGGKWEERREERGELSGAWLRQCLKERSLGDK